MAPRYFDYQRCSDPRRQPKGDSFPRQSDGRDEWCLAQGWIRDDNLDLVDRGVSAFRGRHRLKGAFKRFLDGIQTGYVCRNDVLVIENLDRFSREELDEAWDMWEGILKAGARIAVGPPWRIYDENSLKDPWERIMPQLEMYRAHEESKRKSEMVLSAWNRRLEKARRGEGIGRLRPPGWIFRGEHGYEFREPHAKALRYAAQLVRDGHPLRQVCRMLREDPDTYPYPGTSGRWQPPTLGAILRGRAILGDFASKTGVIRGVWPALLTEDEWLEVGAALRSRAHKRGRPAKDHVENLFPGIVFNAETGKRVHIARSKGPAGDPNTYTYIADQDGKILCPYLAFRATVLRMLTELKPENIIGHTLSNGGLGEQMANKKTRHVAVCEAIQAIQEEIEAAKAEPQARKLLLESLRKLAGEREGIERELDRLRVDARMAQVEAVKGMQTVLDLYSNAPDSEKPALAVRVKQEVAFMVREIWVLVQKLEGRRKLVHVRLYLRVGEPKYACFPCGLHWQNHSFKPWGLADYDLRDWRAKGGM